MSFWDELDAAEKAGTFPPKQAKKIARQCSICGLYGHNRLAHGWTGRNMSNTTARQLVAARKAAD